MAEGGQEPTQAELEADLATPIPESQSLRGNLKELAAQQKKAAAVAVAAIKSFGKLADEAYKLGKPDDAAAYMEAAALAGKIAADNSGQSVANNLVACEFQAGGCEAQALESTDSKTASAAAPSSAAGLSAALAALKVTETQMAHENIKIDFAKSQVTTSEGTVMPFSRVDLKAALSAEGMKSSDIKILTQAMTKTAAPIIRQSATLKRSSSEVVAVSKAPAVTKIPQEKLGISRDPAQVQGLQVMLQGEPIGVSADVSFKMVGRRYERLKKTGAFLP